MGGRTCGQKAPWDHACEMPVRGARGGGIYAALARPSRTSSSGKRPIFVSTNERHESIVFNYQTRTPQSCRALTAEGVRLRQERCRMPRLRKSSWRGCGPSRSRTGTASAPTAPKRCFLCRACVRRRPSSRIASAGAPARVRLGAVRPAGCK